MVGAREKVRLFVYLLITLLVYPINSPLLLFFVLLIAFAVFFALKTPVRFLRSLFYANIFMFFIVGTLLLFDFERNLKTATVIFLKATAILVFTFALILPLGVVKLTRTLEAVGVPKKFTLMVLLSYRYIHSVREEYEKISKAAKLRGFEPHFNLKTYRTYGYMLGMLTLKTYFKARQVYKAMLCRGYGA